MADKQTVFVREWFFNIAVAAYYSSFAYNHLLYYLDTGHLTTLLFLIYETLIVFLALIRRIPTDVSFSVRDWLVAGIGTYTPLMMISSKGAFAGDSIVLALQLLAIVFSFVGMLSLNRSYGTVPANRGVRTNGLYRFVRHPVYAGYFVSLTCFALQNLSSWDIALWNILLALVTLTAMVFRIRYEEEFLMRDEAYQAFAEKTRYRILPGVW